MPRTRSRSGPAISWLRLRTSWRGSRNTEPRVAVQVAVAAYRVAGIDDGPSRRCHSYCHCHWFSHRLFAAKRSFGYPAHVREPTAGIRSLPMDEVHVPALDLERDRAGLALARLDLVD